MNEKCPKCGEFVIDLIDAHPINGLRCHENQLSQARAKIAELKRELKLWKPMTDEEAEAALAEAEAQPIDEEVIKRIVAKVTDPTYRPTEPEHVLMAAKINQLEANITEKDAEIERLKETLRRVCNKYCHWYIEGRAVEAGDCAYEMNCIAGVALSEPPYRPPTAEGQE